MPEDSDLATNAEAENTAALSFFGSSGLHEFIRYFAASALALAIDASLLWLLTSVLSVQYLVSGALAFMAGLIVVYILSIVWVFERRSVKDPFVEFVTFALIGIAGLLINELILWLFTAYIGLFYLMSKGVSVVVVFAWNFGVRKWFLFRGRERT